MKRIATIRRTRKDDGKDEKPERKKGAGGYAGSPAYTRSRRKFHKWLGKAERAGGRYRFHRIWHFCYGTGRLCIKERCCRTFGNCTVRASDRSSGLYSVRTICRTIGSCVFRAGNRSSDTCIVRISDRTTGLSTVRAGNGASGPCIIRTGNETSGPCTVRAGNGASSPCIIRTGNGTSGPCIFRTGDGTGVTSIIRTCYGTTIHKSFRCCFRRNPSRHR